MMLIFEADKTSADVTADLLDPRLEEQYDWAMFVDVHELKGYLQYPGSRLYPLTDVRVIYRPLAKGKRGADYVKAKVYEEFWYHNHIPVGLKRNEQLKIAPDKFGIIYVQPRDGEGDHLDATANAVVRIAADLWLNDVLLGYVVVPYNLFDQMVSELGRFNFSKSASINSGAQLTIHLRSNPAGRDQIFFYQKGYQ